MTAPRYLSTRGQSPALDFADTVLAGLAPDGGLYVPDHLPHFSPAELKRMATLSYPDLAYEIIAPFAAEAVGENALRDSINRSYAGFHHAAIAPLKQLSANHWLLELFHGPTLAFKDFALQFLGNLLEHLLRARGEHVTVIGATSGDTGSAAIAGCRGKANMDIFILHPEGRVSDVQRRQMTTVADANVHNLAVAGTFDDCQAIVKALFADAEFRTKHKLVAVNSINWARVMAQMVYYFYAGLRVGPARFCVPTGNFGNVYAGFLAARMGLPVEGFILASNRNDILTRAVETGQYRMQGVAATLSPSMDIEISSNFERVLFDLSGRDAAVVREMMADLRVERGFTLPPALHAALRAQFQAGRLDDAETLAAMAELYKTTGEILDPHTAVGVGVAAKFKNSPPVVTLATAHPAKFPDAVQRAIGVNPALPPHVAPILTLPERMRCLENTLDAVKSSIEATRI